MPTVQERLQSEIDCLEQCAKRLSRLATEVSEQKDDVNLAVRSATNAAQYLKVVARKMWD
jgi:hypothetical protein